MFFAAPSWISSWNYSVSMVPIYANYHGNCLTYLVSSEAWIFTRFENEKKKKLSEGENMSSPRPSVVNRRTWSHVWWIFFYYYYFFVKKSLLWRTGYSKLSQRFSLSVFEDQPGWHEARVKILSFLCECKLQLSVSSNEAKVQKNWSKEYTKAKEYLKHLEILI